MFVPLWLLALAGFVFVVLAALAFRPRGGGEMIQDQQRDARRIAAHVLPRPAHAVPRPAHAPTHRPAVPPDEAIILAVPEIRAALTGGHKLEAIKLVRERTGLGLKEAKDLVERLLN